MTVFKISAATHTPQTSVNRKVFFLTATALALVMTATAYAQEVEIADERTSEVRTSTASNGAPADIVILEEGSIVVSSGTALVIDSDNKVDIKGDVVNDGRNDAIGIDIKTGTGIDSDLLISGIVRLDGDFGNKEDIVGQSNTAIRIAGDGAFTGNIVTTSSAGISVFGTNSVGIDLGTDLEGSLKNGGILDFNGKDAIGIAVRGNVSGDVENSGALRGVRFGGETGMLIEGDVGGSLLNLGSIVTGKNRTFDRKFNVIPQESGGPGVFISGNIAKGFVNGPPVIPDEPERDENGFVIPVPGAGASISSRGEGRAVLISTVRTDGSMNNVTLGEFGTGDEAFGFINRGSIQATSSERTFTVNSIRIEGSRSNNNTFLTTIEGGFLNGASGTVTAQSLDRAATAISIGDHVVLPMFKNAGTISAESTRSSSESSLDTSDDAFGPGGDATAIDIAENVQINTIINSGTILAVAAGSQSSARAIVDRSGNINLFENSGVIGANLRNRTSGVRIAADFSRSAIDMTVRNSGTIIGDVLLGSGNNTVTMTKGVMTGALDLGAGTNTLTLNEESSFSGQLSGEIIDLTVNNSSFRTTTAIPTLVRNATFTNSSTLSLSIQGDADRSGALIASDTVFIGAGTRIDPTFFSFPGTGEPLVLISADSLILEDDLADLNLQIGLSSIIFDQSLDLRLGDSEELVVSLRRRTADEIGLSERRGLFYEASVAGLEGDNLLGAAIANIDSVGSLSAALDQIAPETGEMPRYTALTNQTMALGVLSQRFSTLRDNTGVEFINSARSARAQAAAERVREATRGNVTAWLQEIGYVANRDTKDDVIGFKGEAVGFAAGVDVPAFGLDAIGLSVMQTIGDYRDDLAGKDDFDVLSTQLNIYGSYSTSGFFVDAVGTYSFLSFERTRLIDFEDFSRRVEGDWNARQYGGSAQAGYRLDMGRYGLTASGNINYVKLSEKEYQEVATSGSGFIVEKRNTTSLRAGANLTFDALFSISDDIKIRPLLRGGYLTELSDNEIKTDVRFESGGDTFQLTSPIALDDSFLGGVGLSFLTDNVNIAFSYEQERSKAFTSHIGSLSIRVRF